MPLLKKKKNYLNKLSRTSIMEKNNSHEEQVKNLCYKIYPKKIAAALQVPTKPSSFHDYLRMNRMSHMIEEFADEYRIFKQNFVDELKLIEKIIGKKKFMIIKTLSSYPHITSDIDVLTTTKQLAEEAKKKLPHDKDLPIPIDVNNIISWTNTEEISHKFIWQNIQEIVFEKQSFLVPNTKLDTLIRIGHIPFELAEVRLGELMHIFNASKNIDWDILYREAKEMKWEQTFNRMQDKIEELHVALYGESFFTQNNKIKIHSDELYFPYRMSYLDLGLAMVEKKAWEKIKGARYIIKDQIQLWVKKMFS